MSRLTEKSLKPSHEIFSVGVAENWGSSTALPHQESTELKLSATLQRDLVRWSAGNTLQECGKSGMRLGS